MQKSLALILVVLPFACGPAARQSPGGDDDDDGNGGDAGNNQMGSGSNGSDCGTVNQPQSSPLALPDTNEGDENPTCTSNASCPSSAPNCVITADTADGGPGYCAVSYVDTLDFIGFGSGATLTDVSKLIAVCATVEHSWLGDLQIDLISPDGKTVALRQFIGRTLSPYFLGHPDYCDTDANPVPGSGYQYCWTAAATTKFLTADNTDCAASGGCEQWNGLPTNSSCGTDGDLDDSPPYQVVPAGNYLPDVGFSALQGAQLNGKWTFRVTDLWAEDNGYLFDWSIQFDSSLVANCSNPIIQ
jgi:Proprotein convertase P-domain